MFDKSKKKVKILSSTEGLPFFSKLCFSNNLLGPEEMLL